MHSAFLPVLDYGDGDGANDEMQASSGPMRNARKAPTSLLASLRAVFHSQRSAAEGDMRLELRPALTTAPVTSVRYQDADVGEAQKPVAAPTPTPVAAITADAPTLQLAVCTTRLAWPSAARQAGRIPSLLRDPSPPHNLAHDAVVSRHAAHA